MDDSPLGAGRAALPALQLEAGFAGGAVDAVDAESARVQAGDAARLLHVAAGRAGGDARLALEQQLAGAAEAGVGGGAVATVAVLVARLAARS